MAVTCPKCRLTNADTFRFCADCGTQLSSAKDIRPGVTETLQTAVRELTTGSTFAGRYQVIEELGHGGMGKVYKVFDTDVKEKIALKVLRPEIGLDAETVERFSNELKLARKISHRNICRMFDLGKADGTTFITMEFVPGEDLKRLIRKSGQLGAGRAVSIARQVGEGLAEAHRLGVVHRDLKPQNIMVDEDGNARIMDFGIARSLKVKGITGAGIMIGTPEYMSPEQVEAKEIDQRSDIYSLGIILYEMLTGRVPFEGDTALSVAMKHKGEIPISPKQRNPAIPDDLSHAILKCLEKDRINRYQTAADVVSELDKIEKGIPTTERIVPPRKTLASKRITVQFEVKKLTIPAIALIGVIAAGLLIWKVIPRKASVPAPSDKPTLAVMYFKNNTGDQKLDHWRTALSDLVTADLTQSRYIRVVSGDMLFNVLRQLDLLEAKAYSREELIKVAQRGGASHILVGDYSRAGNNFRINVAIQKADSGESLGAQSVDGKGEENIISMVDELTKKIKVGLKLTPEEIASDIDKEVGKITTSSAQAYRFYDEGRNLHHKAEFRESIGLMEKALALDPGFAMAYRSMAMSYNNLLMFSDKTKYLQKAYELKDRLSDRERYIIEGDLFRETEKTYPKAIEAYTQLLKLYPDDTIAGTNQAILYSEIEEWDQAIERYQVQVRNGERTFFPYGNQSEALMAKGMYDKAREVLELYIATFGEHTSIREDLALSHFYQGNYDLALVEARIIRSFDPDNVMSLILEGIISQCRGDYAEAEKKYLEVLNTKELGYHLYARVALAALNSLKGRLAETRAQFTQGLGLAEKLGDNWWMAVYHTMLSGLYLGSRKPEEAIKESDLAWNVAQKANNDLRWQRRALFYKGLAYLEAKAMNAARKTADELKKMCDEGMNKKDIRYHHYLSGMIELEKKNYSSSIEYFQKAISLLPYQHEIGPFTNDQAMFGEALALAYDNAGDKEKARKEYESIASMTMGKLYRGDIYVRTFYKRGRIDEELGLKDRAKEMYRKFLDLWKDADPGIPEVEDAKARLAKLIGS